MNEIADEESRRLKANAEVELLSNGRKLFVHLIAIDNVLVFNSKEEGFWQNITLVAEIWSGRRLS